MKTRPLYMTVIIPVGLKMKCGEILQLSDVSLTHIKTREYFVLTKNGRDLTGFCSKQ